MGQCLRWVFAHAKDAWAVAGPFVGILVGAYIASRNQRKHWIADNKKMEYQELVTALVIAFNAMRLRGTATEDPAATRALLEKEDMALITISDRVFIRADVARLDIYSRWLSVRDEFNRTGDVKNLADGAGDIRVNLLDEAEQLMD